MTQKHKDIWQSKRDKEGKLKWAEKKKGIEEEKGDGKGRGHARMKVTPRRIKQAIPQTI